MFTLMHCTSPCAGQSLCGSTSQPTMEASLPGSAGHFPSHLSTFFTNSTGRNEETNLTTSSFQYALLGVIVVIKTRRKGKNLHCNHCAALQSWPWNSWQCVTTHYSEIFILIPVVKLYVQPIKLPEWLSAPGDLCPLLFILFLNALLGKGMVSAEISHPAPSSLTMCV